MRDRRVLCVLVPAGVVALAWLVRGALVLPAALVAVWGTYLAALAIGTDWAEARRALGPSRRAAWPWAAASVALALPPLFVAFLPTAAELGPRRVGLLVGLASANGALEELFWRGSFALRHRDVLSGVLLPLSGYVAWHVALALVPGITLQGGPAALLGGSVVMGAVWTLATRALGSMRWPLVGHVLTNLFAFAPLLLHN